MQQYLIRGLGWLSRVQTTRPWAVVSLAALTLIPALLTARQLELRTSFSELLPDDKPSVIELGRVERRLAGQSTLTVVAQGGTVDQLKHFVDALAPRVAALGPEWVTRVDTGTREARAYFERHAALYAELEDIEAVHEAVVERYDERVARAAGFDLGLDEEEEEVDGNSGEPAKDEPLTVKELEERLQQRADAARARIPVSMATISTQKNVSPLSWFEHRCAAARSRPVRCAIRYAPLSRIYRRAHGVPSMSTSPGT